MDVFCKVKQGIIHPHIAVNVNGAPLALALEAILSAEVCAVNAQWLQIYQLSSWSLSKEDTKPKEARVQHGSNGSGKAAQFCTSIMN